MFCITIGDIMSRFGEQVPGYLLGKQQLIATVAFTVLCSLVFLCLAAPFSDNLWFSFTSLKPFGISFKDKGD